MGGQLSDPCRKKAYFPARWCFLSSARSIGGRTKDLSDDIEFLSKRIIGSHTRRAYDHNGVLYCPVCTNGHETAAIREKTSGETLLPVQVMVPINLRKQFASDSLRNFSLYALPKLPPEAADAPFSEIVQSMAVQIQAQSAKSRLRAAIATNAALEQKTASFPLWMKCAALRAGFEVCGGRSSCITVSNLGWVTLPDCIQQELERLDFMLTPRVHSPYNCGIVSLGDRLSLTITRRGKDKGVEKRFALLLVKQGIIPVVVEEEILQIAI